MAIPYSNTTCDIYRHGHTPPAAPDVAGVHCSLEPKGQSTLTTDNYSHVLLVPATTDIRDKAGSGLADLNTDASWCDSVYVPDKTGTQFWVVLVRRKGRGTALDHKQVLLVRRTLTWPSNDL